MKILLKVLFLIIIGGLSYFTAPIIYNSAVGNFRSPARVTLIILILSQGIVLISILFWKSLPKILSVLFGILLLAPYLILIYVIIDIYFGDSAVFYNYMIYIFLFTEFAVFYYKRYLKHIFKSNTIPVSVFIIAIILSFSIAKTKISINKEIYSLYYSEKFKNIKMGMDIKDVLAIMGTPRKKSDYELASKTRSIFGSDVHYGPDFKYFRLDKEYPYIIIIRFPRLFPDEHTLLRDQIYLNFKFGKLDYILNNL